MNTVLLTFKRCLFFVCVSGNFPFSFFLLPVRTFRFRFSKTVFSFFGLYVADNFDERIEQKIFHAEIVVDHTKISAEEKAYQKIPVINDFKDRNGNDIMMQQIQRNYDQIKADAQAIINEEMRRIKNDPELRKRLGLEDEKGKDPDKS